MARERHFPEEIFQCGEPDLRPEEGHIVLSRTRGMAALDARYYGHALMATVEGLRPPVSPAALVAAMEEQCGVLRENCRVEVTYPADFFVIFRSSGDCERVLHFSRCLRCCGTTISFCRWSRMWGADSSELAYYSKISIEGLPACGWEAELVSDFITKLNGKLVDIEPRSDRWCLTCFAWLKDPCSIPKRLKVEIPQPLSQSRNISSDPDDSSSPLVPIQRTVWKTVTYPIIVHVHEVLDRGPLITDLPSAYIDKDEDTTRLHRFPVWAGRIDGTGPSNVTETGGHPFRGPGTRGLAGGLEDDGVV